MRRTERGLYFSAMARITRNTPLTLPSMISEEEEEKKLRSAGAYFLTLDWVSLQMNTITR